MADSMTARTRAIERKLVEWFSKEGADIANRDSYPMIWTVPLNGRTGAPILSGHGKPAYIRLLDLATAIELGEIS